MMRMKPKKKKCFFSERSTSLSTRVLTAEHKKEIGIMEYRNIGKTVLLVFCSLVLVFLSGAEVQAATNTATAGTTWARATWSWVWARTNQSDDAIINSGVNLTIGTAAVCGSLTIGQPGPLRP